MTSACHSLFQLDGFGDKTPFEHARWQSNGKLHVQVQGTWYQLLAIEGIPLEQIKPIAKEVYQFYWKRRIIEDIPAVMSIMGEYEFFNIDLTLKE